MYTVYCHIFPNGKRYVGLTKHSVEKRWENGNKYKTCPLVYRAIQKYGWENVKHEILSTVKTIEEAEAKERYYISKYRTTDPEYGYNILPGGDVSDNAATKEIREKMGRGWRGKRRSEEEREKISLGVKRTFSRQESNGHIGMKATGETRLKMSNSSKKAWESEERKKDASRRMAERMADEAFKKKVLDNLSKYRRKSGQWSMPEEAKKKISEATKGRWIGEKSPTSKPVLQFSRDGEFIKRWENAGAVERAGIALRSNVAKCCRGAPHCKTAGGFVWRFENE